MSHEHIPPNFGNWERRTQPRVDVRANIIVWADGREIKARMRDISKGGMYVECHPPLPEGTPCTAEFGVRDGDGVKIHNLTGRVAHSESWGMGIAFDMLPADTQKAVDMIVESEIAKVVAEFE